VIETGRLVLRPVSAADDAELHALFSQPGVRRFLFDDEVVTPLKTAEIIGTSETLFTQHGFGLWLARLRERGAAVGFGGFWYFRDPPELELLYGVGDDHRKKGYGREIARAVIAYGEEVLEMPTIRASTDAGHLESQRLLEELGFKFERRAIVGGLDTVFYTRE